MFSIDLKQLFLILSRVTTYGLTNDFLSKTRTTSFLTSIIRLNILFQLDTLYDDAVSYLPNSVPLNKQVYSYVTKLVFQLYQY